VEPSRKSHADRQRGQAAAQRPPTSSAATLVDSRPDAPAPLERALAVDRSPKVRAQPVSIRDVSGSPRVVAQARQFEGLFGPAARGESDPDRRSSGSAPSTAQLNTTQRVVQRDELDSAESRLNPQWLPEGQEGPQPEHQYLGTPSGKFSSEPTADKREAVAKRKADEEARGLHVPHQPVADLGELYAHNAMLKAEYDHQVKAIAAASGGDTKFRSGEGMKSLGRTLEKITADYGGDASRIIDLTGASIYYESVDALIKGYKAVEGNAFFNVIRVKNSLAKASGYGDINLAVEMGSADFEIEVDGRKKIEHYPGFVIELQLHLTSILEQKEVGHKQYEEQRKIAAKFPGTKRSEWEAGKGGVTKEDMANYDRLEKEMLDIYAIGWKKMISWTDFMNPRLKDKMQPVRDKLSAIAPKG
jgi:hypothetical protein